MLRDPDQATIAEKVIKPVGYKAVASNQVRSWDIIYLSASIRGAFYRLYLVLDVFSRKIVGWEVHKNESADHASVLIRKTCEYGLVLHADNGGQMKGAAMLATLQKLGIVPSFSRPSVSNYNPCSENPFRTLKYAARVPENKPF